MDETTKRYHLQIMNAPCKKLSDEQFREWVRLTMFYASCGCGEAFSKAATQLTMDSMHLNHLDGQGQIKSAVELLVRSGREINFIRDELELPRID